MGLVVLLVSSSVVAVCTSIGSSTIMAVIVARIVGRATTPGIMARANPESRFALVEVVPDRAIFRDAHERSRQ